MALPGRNTQEREDCLSVGSKVILSIKKRKAMAENEFEKNVRKEMDEFKVHPSKEIWPKIEERIRERNRKRRILFFVLFPLIALMIGYGVYNFSGSNTRPKDQHELS